MNAIYGHILERAKEVLIHALALHGHPYGLHWEINQEAYNWLLRCWDDPEYNTRLGNPVEVSHGSEVVRILGKPASVVDDQDALLILYVNKTPFGKKPMMLGAVLDYQTVQRIDYKDVFKWEIKTQPNPA